MARIGVTYYEVEKACEALLAQQQALTVDNVRRKLGDTGSRSTIAKHLKDWKERQARQKSPESLTDGLANVLRDQSGLIYTAIRDDIEKQFQREREKLQHTINELELKQDDLHDHADQLMHSLAELRQAQANDENTIHVLNAKINDLLEDVKQRDHSLAFQAGQIDALKTAVDEKNKTEAVLTERIEALITENSKLLSDKDYLFLRNKYDGEKLVKLENNATQLTDEIKRLREKIIGSEAKLALLQQLNLSKTTQPSYKKRSRRN